MRRALPWVLLLCFLGFGALVVYEASRDPLVSDVTDDEAAARGAPVLRGRQPARVEAGASVTGDPAGDPAAAAATLVTLEPFPVQGHSRFQKRLSVGEELFRVGQEIAAKRLPQAAARTRIIEFRSHFLGLDRVAGFMRQEQAFRDGGVHLLGYLTEPRRDPAGISLHGIEESEDALGSNLRIRTWTRAGPLSKGAVRSADALIERLDAHSGVLSEGGFDVLATPAMGNDVFPERTLPFPFPVAGYYTSQDDLCVIGTRYAGPFVQLVLKHELVHAWQHRHVPAMRSRFLQEGLAEYLSRLESSDFRLELPPRRIRDELAALRGMLLRMERFGMSWSGLQPGELVRLNPRDFYAIGHLGYVLGLATFAYIGGETVELALKTGSSGPLISAIQEMDWEAFMAFLEEHAEGGRAAAALWVQDGRGDEDLRLTRAQRYRRSSSVLRGLGVAVPPGMSARGIGQLLEAERAFPAQEAGAILPVLDALLGGESRLLFVADATRSMELPFRGASVRGSDGESLLDEALSADTRQTFATRLFATLRSAAKDGSATTGCMSTNVRSCTLPVELSDSPLSLEPLPRWLGRSGVAGASLVVCLGSEDRQRDAIREAIARSVGSEPADVEDGTLRHVLAGLVADLLDRHDVSPAVVLVVDLADGASDALALAQAFAERLGSEARVAYWNPQTPLR